MEGMSKVSLPVLAALMLCACGEKIRERERLNRELRAVRDEIIDIDQRMDHMPAGGRFEDEKRALSRAVEKRLEIEAKLIKTLEN
jgi:hypothetical protein